MYVEMLRDSIKGDHALLLLPDALVDLSLYGHKISFSSPSPNTDNHLIKHPDLGEKYLRRVFTGFELLLYKLCHLLFEQGRFDYKWETEKSRSRFRKILGQFDTNDRAALADMFEEIFYVRDAFAHSFVDLADIIYRDIPLKHCFGETYLGGDYDHAPFRFIDDLNFLYSPFVAKFREMQWHQFDKNKFGAVCSAHIAKRSLGPSVRR